MGSCASKEDDKEAVHMHFYIEHPTKPKEGNEKNKHQSQVNGRDWIEHCKRYAKDHNVTYKEALKLASETYVKKKDSNKAKNMFIEEYEKQDPIRFKFISMKKSK